VDEWTLSESEVVAATRWLRIEKNAYLRDGAEVRDYYVLRRPAFVVVIAADDADRVIAMRQYRPATGEFYLAFPAGYIAPGEDPERAAIRELREETGALGRNWRHVGLLDPLPGYIDSRAHIFCCDVVRLDREARVREDGAAEHDPVTMLERSAVREAIVGGQITEMQAVSAFLLAEAVTAAYPAHERGVKDEAPQ
jgi:ADP-ribose pyrophosphatase